MLKRALWRAVGHPEAGNSVAGGPGGAETAVVDVQLRWATDDDFDAIVRADERGFSIRYEPGDLDDIRPLLHLDRFCLAEIDGRVVGVTGDHPLDVTVPGGRRLPVPGVTWVSVTPGFRRRGILRALIEEQHRRLVAEGRCFSALTASEGSLYGRFGFGPATLIRRIEIDRRRTALRHDIPHSAPVRLVEDDEARRLLPELHHRWCAITPGAVNRPGPWWDMFWRDRHKKHPRFVAVHPDGFVVYRSQERWGDGVADHEADVVDLVPVTDAANADLWGFLLDLDLHGHIRTWHSPVDDPLPFWLTDPRAVRTLAVSDGMWVRILDVAGSLAARTYAVPGELVLDVRDPVWDRRAVVRLDAGPEGATCVATRDEPDLSLRIDALSSSYLGGHRLRTLARSGLVTERRPGALARADAMFATDRAPTHGTEF